MKLRGPSHQDPLVVVTAPQDASPRGRMIAEWTERMERRAVPWLLEIGIPGLLYIALCLFFTGAIMRSLPYPSKAIYGVFGILFMVVCVVL